MDRDHVERLNGEPANGPGASNQGHDECADQLEHRMEHANDVLKNTMAQLKQAGGALRDNDTRLETGQADRWHYRDLLDGIDAVVWETSPDGRVVFVNRRAHELFGYPAERWLLVRCFWHEIAHPGDRVYATANFFECAGDGHDRELEYRIIAADGRIVWVRESLRAARDGHGRVEVVRGVMWSIGRRKKVERKLQFARSELADQLADALHLQELSRRLWATADFGSLLEEILTATMAILGAEIGMVRLYNEPQAELEIAASVGLPEKYLVDYARVPAGDLAGGLASERETPVIVDDVEIATTSSAYREELRIGGFRARYTTLLTSQTGKLLGTVASCFRELHRPPARQIRLVELFMRQAAEFVDNARLIQGLRAAERRKDEALATLAHEIRHPLALISSLALVLKSDATQGQRAAEICDLIINEAQLLARLANDLKVER